MDKILDIARRYDLKVIEDAAHALPAYYRGHPGEMRSARHGHELHGAGRTEERGQEGTEIGGQMSEVGKGQKAEDRGQEGTEVGGQMSEVGKGQKAEFGGQSSDVRSQRTEDKKVRGEEDEKVRRMIGSIGDITCFSFYVTKPLTIQRCRMRMWSMLLRRLRQRSENRD
jgi:hypothetical protein